VSATADQSTAWGSAAVKTMALSGGPYTLSPGYYFRGPGVEGTTPPTFGRQQNFNSTITNTGLANSAARVAANGTAATLPASLTLGSNSIQQVVMFAARS
jgi:hypothetical protein